MPDRKKGPSLAKAARTYRRAHTKPKVKHDGSHYWSDGASPHSVGTTENKLTYKPKARAGTFGGAKGGKPATRYVKRNKGI